MLEAIDEIIPIGNPDWERVWDRHMACYPQKERTAESLRRKFQTLVLKKMKTGDPNCPPHIRSAKRIYRKIVEATDGSDGQSYKDVDDDDGEEDNEEDNDDGKEDDKEDDDGSIVIVGGDAGVHTADDDFLLGDMIGRGGPAHWGHVSYPTSLW